MGRKPQDPVDKAVGLIDSGLTLASSMVGKKIEEFQSDAERRVEEVREEVVESAYEAKRALIRTMVEGILLSTGLVSFVLGVLLFFRGYGIPLYQVLIAYGLLVTVYSLFKMKTSP